MAKDQGELPGIRPAHIKRLEEIEEDLKKNEGKISRLRADNRKLSDEAVGIYKEHDLKSTRITDGEEWYVDMPAPKYKHRRYKDSKDEPGKEAADKSKDKRATG